MKHCKRVVLFVGTILLTMPVLSGETASIKWEIDKKLLLLPPENLDVTFQILDALDPWVKMVYGWKGEQLSYVVHTKTMERGFSMRQHWVEIMEVFRADTELENFTSAFAEDFYTNNNQKASCSSVKYFSEGENIFQTICIVFGIETAYYIIGSSIDDEVDEDYIANNVRKLTENVIVTN